MRRLIAGLLCLLAAGCSTQSMSRLTGGCGLGERTTLPVEMRGQLPVVQAVVNDRAAELVIDTGATTTILNQAAASILGLQRLAGPGFGYTTVQGTVTATRASIASLRLGGLTFSDLSVGVTREAPEDGVLGLDVLARFDLDVNLPMGEITLHEGGLCPGQAPPYPSAVLELPAARLAHNGAGIPEPYLIVPVRLDGVSTFGILDSGAGAGSLVSEALAERAGLQGAAAGGSLSVIGFGGSAVLGVHRFGELLVGREQFLKPALLVGGDTRVVFPVILGHDYFISHRIWFNFAADRIFVVPQSQPIGP